MYSKAALKRLLSEFKENQTVSPDLVQFCYKINAPSKTRPWGTSDIEKGIYNPNDFCFITEAKKQAKSKTEELEDIIGHNPKKLLKDDDNDFTGLKV